MNKQIYLGGTPLIDLSGYATESYVDTAVSNVDVTDQLQNYVQKTALDSSVAAIDASIANSDASISSIKSILSQITGDGAEVTAAIDTFNELKQFVADYTTSNDLSTLINNVKTQAIADASADAAGKYQPIGSYLVADDISTFITNDDISTFITSDDISTFVDSATVAATYETKNDASNHVAGAGVTNIVTISAADYALLEEKSATTLYIVSD